VRHGHTTSDERLELVAQNGARWSLAAKVGLSSRSQPQHTKKLCQLVQRTSVAQHSWWPTPATRHTTLSALRNAKTSSQRAFWNEWCCAEGDMPANSAQAQQHPRCVAHSPAALVVACVTHIHTAALLPPAKSHQQRATEWCETTIVCAKSTRHK
jgi:hypothetical protein